MHTDYEKEPWHLDKRVPIALILTIMLQSGAAVWFAASLSFRVDILERDVDRERVVNGQQSAAIHQIENGAARLDEKLDSIITLIERMDRRLERMDNLP